MRSQGGTRTEQFREIKDLSNEREKAQNQLYQDIEDQIDYKYRQDFSLEKCTNCRKYKPKKFRKRAIDASPLKFKNGRANSAHKLPFANGQDYHSLSDGRKTTKNSIRGESREKSNSQLRMQLEKNHQKISDAKSINMLKFMDKNKSKGRLELAKAYNA